MNLTIFVINCLICFVIYKRILIIIYIREFIMNFKINSFSVENIFFLIYFFYTPILKSFLTLFLIKIIIFSRISKYLSFNALNVLDTRKNNYFQLMILINSMDAIWNINFILKINNEICDQYHDVTVIYKKNIKKYI